jgi:hypothetical protein
MKMWEQLGGGTQWWERWKLGELDGNTSRRKNKKKIPQSLTKPNRKKRKKAKHLQFIFFILLGRRAFLIASSSQIFFEHGGKLPNIQA